MLSIAAVQVLLHCQHKGHNKHGADGWCCACNPIGQLTNVLK
jgi:hypothetical protein